MHPPELDKLLGMEFYGTNYQRVGGVIRKYPTDFVVREVIKWFGASPLYLNKNFKAPFYGPYLITILVKKKWDNILALRELCRRLNIRGKNITILGIKDARALTSQFLLIKKPDLKRTRLNIEELKLYPVTFTSLKLNPSHLLGNLFYITIRNLNCESSILNLLMKKYEDTSLIGVIPNFFGHQRFGSIRPISHLIGEQIVKRNFENAVIKYLTFPSKFDPHIVSDAKKLIEEKRDFGRAFKKMPKKYSFEKMMLKCLKNRPSDFFTVLRKLPLKLRKMLVNAYQAYLFNKTLSLRINSGLGLNKPEIGDLVNIKIPYGFGSHIERAETNNILRLNKLIAKRKATLNIPLFGYKTLQSGGQQGIIEKKVLEEENINTRLFYVSPLPEVSCEGGFRSTTIKISAFQYCTKKNSLNLRFFLEKSNYATTVLREIMKPMDPVNAGF